jgi:hypothetical protein
MRLTVVLERSVSCDKRLVDFFWHILQRSRLSSLSDNSGGTFPEEILPTNSQSGVFWKIPGKQEVLGIKIKDTVVGRDLVELAII